MLDYIFTQSDLYWLDHLLPEEQIRHQEDVAKVNPSHYDPVVDEVCEWRGGCWKGREKERLVKK